MLLPTFSRQIYSSVPQTDSSFSSSRILQLLTSAGNRKSLAIILFLGNIYSVKTQPGCYSVFFSVEWLVVDESDKLFEDGKTGFREQLATIFLACSGSKVRRAFFSATCTSDVEQWCRLNLDNLVSVNIGPR